MNLNGAVGVVTFVGGLASTVNVINYDLLLCGHMSWAHSLINNATLSGDISSVMRLHMHDPALT